MATLIISFFSFIVAATAIVGVAYAYVFRNELRAHFASRKLANEKKSWLNVPLGKNVGDWHDFHLPEFESSKLTVNNIILSSRLLEKSQNLVSLYTDDNNTVRSVFRDVAGTIGVAWSAINHIDDGHAGNSPKTAYPTEDVGQLINRVKKAARSSSTLQGLDTYAEGSL